MIGGFILEEPGSTAILCAASAVAQPICLSNVLADPTWNCGTTMALSDLEQ